jgi:hypothetical protein
MFDLRALVPARYRTYDHERVCAGRPSPPGRVLGPGPPSPERGGLDGEPALRRPVFIFWDRPFVLGDLIEVDGKYGRVEKITLRSTRVITVEGKMFTIPNAEVMNSTVASYTNFPHLRIEAR